MSNGKNKRSYKMLSGLLAILMIAFSVPVSMIAYATNSEYDYLQASNLTAEYNATDDSIEVSWDAIEGTVDSVDIDLDSAIGDSVITGNSYTFDSTTVSALAGGSHVVNLTAKCGTQKRTAQTDVTLPYNLVSVGSVAATDVDNDLTMAQIVAQMPTTVELTAESQTVSANVTWNTEGTDYDKTLATAQTFDVSGTVTLPSNVVNRNDVSLNITGVVNSAAAIPTAISENPDSSASKKVDESVTMSVAATGTAVTYQWYKKTASATEAKGTTASYTYSPCALSDNGAEFYCVVTGKDGSTAESGHLTLSVSKVDTAIGVSVTPPEEQVRPEKITISVTNLPADAAGKLKYTVGTKVVTVPISLSSLDFGATGDVNTYDISVEYLGDDVKYNGSSTSVLSYSFTKGTQYAEFDATTVPATKTFGDADFTVAAKNTDDKGSNQFEFSIVNEERVDSVTTPGSVATIDSTGKVTIKNAGVFQIQVKAKANNDYNESEAVLTDEIKVNRAQQADLSFESGASEIPYSHDFSVQRALANSGSGVGGITYSLDAATVATGFQIDSASGEVTYINKAADNDKNVVGTLGFVKVLVTKAADNQYAEKTASYSFTVVKTAQADFEFAAEPPTDGITYTANGGTTYTNVIGTKNGSVTVNNDVVYSLAGATDLDNNVIAAADLATINSETGTITAKRSGILTVKAYRAGNNVYEEIDTTYTIKINRGTVEGFGFAITDTNSLKTKYGVQFANAASGGQSDSSTSISYAITNVSEAIASYTEISDNGIVYFDGDYACAADADEYTVTVKATKAQNEKYVSCSISYQLTILRDTVTNADFRLNGNEIKDATKLGETAGWYNQEHENITFTPFGDYNKISTDGKNWENALTYTEEDKATVHFYLKIDDTSKANNGAVTQFSTQKYNYDKTLPEAKLTVVNDNDFWSEFVETITFGLWKKESKQIQIEATDNLSDIAAIYYYEQNSDFNSDKFTKDKIATADISWVGWNQLNSGALSATKTIDVTLDELTNKKVVVYVKVIDCAGNTAYFRSDGMIFDNISPTMEVALSEQPIVNIQLPDTKTEGLYHSDVPFSLTIEDPKTNASGIEQFTVTIEGTDSNGTNHQKVITVKAKASEITSFDSENIDNDEFDVDNTFIVPSDFNSNHITITVDGVDYSKNPFGNADNLTYLAIDMTNPQIDVAYTASNGTKDVEFSNGKYIGNGQNRKATITVTELNFDNSAVVITLNRDGKKIDIAPAFTAVAGGVDANGDQIKWAMEIDYASLVTEDGNLFDFDIAYTDKVGNKNDAVNYGDHLNPQSFVIDNTKPVITVEITNSEVQNDKFFKADRVATVTIKERFFDKNYKFDWSGLTYSLNGTTGNAPSPVAVSSDDNTYIRKYQIDFTTEGDYTFDVKYTDLADNAANTFGCNSVAYQAFTVDKTAPTLDITGVADHSANNGTIAPVVSYSDINFDVNTVSVVLSGSKNGTVSYNNTVNNEAQQGSVTYADFQRVESVDDIYTLSAKLTDKAGNETQKSITFSSNRFGSTYEMTEATRKLNGAYLKKAEDIVFTEVNANELHNIKITLFKNNETIVLKEGEDYRIDVKGGNGSWYEYTYTVFAKNFEDDGVYRLVFHSEDAAGNVAENTLDTKDKEIGFGIDKTAPNIIVTNLENGKTYPLEKMTVKMSVSDNLILNSVRVYLDDYNTEYKSWDEKEIESIISGEGEFDFDVSGDSTSAHAVRIVSTDAAGNEKIEEINDFYVTTNLFVRYYNNKPLFFGTVGGVLLLAGLIAAFVVFKKRKTA